jgi:hypothetical protein
MYTYSKCAHIHIIHTLQYQYIYTHTNNQTMAVNYYKLDLSDASSRYVTQELIHLSTTEPGSSCVDVQLDGCDYEIPNVWRVNVPKRGVLTLYFVRDANVIERVHERGSYDNRYVHDAFERNSASTYVPEWIRYAYIYIHIYNVYIHKM